MYQHRWFGSSSFGQLVSEAQFSAGDLLVQAAIKYQLDVKLESGDIMMVTPGSTPEPEADQSQDATPEPPGSTPEPESDLSQDATPELPLDDSQYDADDELSQDDGTSDTSSEWIISEDIAASLWKRCEERMVLPPLKRGRKVWNPLFCLPCKSSHLVCDWPSMAFEDTLESSWHDSYEDMPSPALEEVLQGQRWQPYPLHFQSRYRPIRCYKCARTGHLAFTCPWDSFPWSSRRARRCW